MRRREVILAGFGVIGSIAYGCRDGQSGERFAQSPTEILQATAAQKTGKTDPARYLQQLSAPKFKPGHTLPRLSRFGWTLPFEARVELADRWGYALEWGPYASIEGVQKALADPKSDEAKAMALAASQPKRYPLAVILSRDLPTTPKTLWLHNDRGELVDGRQIWSPEAPVEALKESARLRAEPLRMIRKKAPIAVVLNGGEYGLQVLGGIQKFAAQDPKVMAAKGKREWFDYISDRKAYQESFITKAVRQAVPNRRPYVYYPSDSNPHHDRYWGWRDWCYDYKYMRNITDYPSSSTYFKEFNSGWTGNMDILTEVLNSVGQQIKFGDLLSYNWVCSGWVRADKSPVFGEIDRYMGFLKCYYMTGTIGCIAGYFDRPEGDGFAALFDADRPPNWLQQIVVLGRVHALFSYLEDYLRQGDLLPGPIKHIWSKDTPAYEFPSADPDVRVVVRKHRQQPTWSMVAWAAAGKSRSATVTIPQLGRVELMARPTGSTYTAKIVNDRIKLTWIDRQEI
jgi:hypothetical protein